MLLIQVGFPVLCLPGLLVMRQAIMGSLLPPETEGLITPIWTWQLVRTAVIVGVFPLIARRGYNEPILNSKQSLTSNTKVRFMLYLKSFQTVFFCFISKKTSKMKTSWLVWQMHIWLSAHSHFPELFYRTIQECFPHTG